MAACVRATRHLETTKSITSGPNGFQVIYRTTGLFKILNSFELLSFGITLYCLSWKYRYLLQGSNLKLSMRLLISSSWKLEDFADGE